ncbi:DJ-1/PfpI family protein [Kitasatospora sp. NPDC056138]|uniref:DJ-1/PfpI family protein n=1 Tax=Kitasatospora sp. NPDC056138 TaxID=3345724 RepID=UPI0035E124EB
MVGMAALQGRTVALPVPPEDAEPEEPASPWDAVRPVGGTARVLSTEPGESLPVHDEVFEVSEASADGLAAPVLPGGVAGPGVLRTDQWAEEFVRGFFGRAGSTGAASCPGLRPPVEADVVRDRALTSWPSPRTGLRTEQRNADAQRVDRAVQGSERGPNVLVAGREPDDLPLLDAALVGRFAEATVART